MKGLRLPVAVGGLLLCVAVIEFGPAKSGVAIAAGPARYMASWTGDEDLKDSDFLAVMDVVPRSPRYGRIITTVPVGMKGLNPHHTEYTFDRSGILFSIGWAGDRSFRFDLRKPEHPVFLGEVQRPSDVHFLHSFVRLPNGHALATYQAEGDAREGAGGLVEFDKDGKFVRRSSARVDGIDPAQLRPYSLTVIPQLDRIVTGCNAMAFPSTGSWTAEAHTVAMRDQMSHEARGHHVQVWRLSDLKLLDTIPLPDDPDGKAVGANEPRVLTDNRTVLVPTLGGALFKLDQIDTKPSIARVFTFEGGSSGSPVVVGRYWIQPISATHSLISYDVIDPAHPKEVGRARLGEKLGAHWVSFDPGGNRLIVADGRLGPGPGENRLWMVNIDPATGKLDVDTRFRNEGSDEPGFSFDLKDWPHGPTGNAMPHGTVFIP